MPGKTIGTQLNPMPELVWQGHILIHKVAREYEVQYQYEKGDPATCQLVREHISRLIEELRKRL